MKARRLILALSLAALPRTSPAEGPSIPESADIPNYKVIAPGLAAAGQPGPEALRRLRELGFRSVVNLRTASEPGVAEEKAIVESQGLKYVHVPLSAATFRLEDAKAVARAVDDAAAAPVLLHCTSANRVGGVWATILAMKGKPLDEAEAEGRKAGLTSDAMLEAARRVAGEARAQPRP
jgi:uncharacterized protein (TIGR01244 family)